MYLTIYIAHPLDSARKLVWICLAYVEIPDKIPNQLVNHFNCLFRACGIDIMHMPIDYLFFPRRKPGFYQLAMLHLLHRNYDICQIEIADTALYGGTYRIRQLNAAIGQ